MRQAPVLMPTSVPQGEAPGIRYRIEGELVPVLHIGLSGQVPVFFEHHIVLWKDPALNITVRPMKGAFKRMVAGMQIFMTMAEGPGEIAFSRDGAIWTVDASGGNERRLTNPKNNDSSPAWKPGAKS